MAPEHLVCDTDAIAARLTRAGHGFRRRLQRAGVGRLRDRIESRAADERRRARRGGLSAADFVRVSDRAATHAPRACGASGLRPSRSPSRRADGARRVDRARLAASASAVDSAPGDGSTRMETVSYEYERVPTPASGLRLHLNENTAGCSPAVLEALSG